MTKSIYNDQTGKKGYFRLIHKYILIVHHSSQIGNCLWTSKIETLGEEGK